MSKENKRKIKVTFPSFMGDESRMMTIQELRNNSGGCLLIDPVKNESITIDEIEIIDLRDVIVFPPISGG